MERPDRSAGSRSAGLHAVNLCAKALRTRIGAIISTMSMSTMGARCAGAVTRRRWVPPSAAGRSACGLWLCAVVAVVAACTAEPRPADYAARDLGSGAVPAPCEASYPLRQAWFGDLHVHTALSSDAWMFGVRATPDDAYRYAFGDALRLAPYDGDEAPGRVVRLARPLDFAALTDHAEFLGEAALCTEADSPSYRSEFCASWRGTFGRSEALMRRIFSPFPSRDADTCGADDALCQRAAASAWRDTVRAAETWNDTSPACQRATLVAYEYSSHRLGSNLHRNVIFRSAVVVPRPISYLEAPREWTLWSVLKHACLDVDRCDVLAIPHNANISNGRMFALDYPGAWSKRAQRERATLRARLEPVVEIMQHKGDSECRNGLADVLGDDDPACDFEKFEDLSFEGEDPGACYGGPLADYVPHLGPDCLQPMSYVRYALIAGLGEGERLGVNPFQMGIIAATDTHNGTGGAVDERRYAGHLGLGDASVAQRLAMDGVLPGNPHNNPGGLTGVWATENSRAAIFDALRRREVFGTSGPRIAPRLFGAWRFTDALCGRIDGLALADAQGVPMGAELPAAGSDATAPVFRASAVADPGAPGEPARLLERLQIVKGWLDDDGRMHQRVIDVAGDFVGRAGVDERCAPQGPGHAALCAVWQDPDFDRDRRAVYYLRVLENPQCRHTRWQCLSLPEDQRPPTCTDGSFPDTIQERAWTSPIWYTSPGAS